MRNLTISLLFILTTLACGLPYVAMPMTATVIQPSTNTFEPSVTSSPTDTFAPPSSTLHPTFTLLPSRTSKPSRTPTITSTPTKTDTPTSSPSPTFAFPLVTVNQQAHCRYGPAKAYLHAADLYVGDTGTVRGRFQMSGWLYVKFDKLKYFCWVAPSIVDVDGDVTTVIYANVNLPGPSVYYNPPGQISSNRNGDVVTITWSKVDMTTDDDRGYFLDLMVCQDDRYLWWPVSLASDNDTLYQVKDQSGCPLPSGGKLYAVEKHGYTEAVKIPWPVP